MASCKLLACEATPYGLMRLVPVWLIAFIISPLCPLSHISNFPINPGQRKKP